MQKVYEKPISQHSILKAKSGERELLHWAFDVGMFTLSDQFEFVVHPKAKLASSIKFPIAGYDWDENHST